MLYFLFHFFFFLVCFEIMDWHVDESLFKKKTPYFYFVKGKERVRPGDIILVSGINAEVVDSEYGKWIRYRLVNNTRSHAKISWESNWQRNPNYKEIELAKRKRQQLLDKFLKDNDLDPNNPPYRWSLEFNDYIKRKHQLEREFNQMQNKKKKKKTKNEDAPLPPAPRSFKSIPLPSTSIFDHIQIKDTPRSTGKTGKSLFRGDGYRAGDPYNDECSYQKYEFVKETSLEFINRMKEDNTDYTLTSYYRDRCDNYGYYDDYDDYDDDTEERIYTDDSSDAGLEMNLFEDFDENIEDIVESTPIVSEENKTNVGDIIKESQDIEDIFDWIEETPCSTSKNDKEEFDISLFQSPSLYSRNQNQSVNDFSIPYSNTRSTLVDSGQNVFSLSENQKNIVDASERIDDYYSTQHQSSYTLNSSQSSTLLILDQSIHP